ncbi:MAG: GNAT family N-acetyltransferase [Anaerolineales bacterium]
MALESGLRLRPAVFADQRRLASLLNGGARVHRHLDWRKPLDWIGSPPFLVLEENDQMMAALACPPDPDAIAWVRLFVVAEGWSVPAAWWPLWEAARQDLAGRGSFTVAAIALQPWFVDVLEASRFEFRQHIVMLERESQATVEYFLPPEVALRSMMTYDLPAVAEVDAAAFEPLWQNSLPALERAYPQAAVATVAEQEGRLVGYQISTPNPLGAHLARLAVLPQAQGRGVGFALIADLIQRLARRRIYRLTVNTQSDNAASLKLYQQIGFRLTDERYPVYCMQIQGGV